MINMEFAKFMFTYSNKMLPKSCDSYFIELAELGSRYLNSSAAELSLLSMSCRCRYLTKKAALLPLLELKK